MKTLYVLPLVAFCALPLVCARAIDLKESKFTEIVHDVEVISAANQSVAPAALDEIFKVPDVLRTGPDSRAELVADDQTVTRVGANTIFSFDPANRTIDLKQGSLLFHSPHGKGGGTIQTGAATASVLGTTIIVSTTPNNGFKVLVLEGHAAVKMSGIAQRLNAGQMIYVLPGGGISPIVVFRLDTETRGSKLVGGFKKPLASAGLIDKAIGNQLKQIKNGQAVDTGLLAGDTATSSSVDAISAATIQALVESQSSPNGPSLESDFTINTSILDINNIFLGTGFNITTDPNGFLGGSDLPNPFFGFPGHNITVSTTTIDLSAYVAQPKFQIVALNNLDVQGSLTVNGLTSANEFDLAAGNQLTIASGSSLEADCGLFWLGGFQPITLDNVSLYNNGVGGGVSLVSGSALTLQNNSLIQADGEAFLQGASVDVDGSSVEGDRATVQTTSGDVTLNDASLTANGGDLTINSANGITASGTTTLTGNSGLISLFANDLVSLSGATINGSEFALDGNASDPVSGTAVTIDNSQIAGGSAVTMFSFNGSMTIQNNSQINSPNGLINIEAESGVTVDNSSLSGATGLSLAADDADLTLQNDASLTSGGDISLGSGQLGFGDILINNSTADGVNVNANSINSITINNNASLTASSAMEIDAGQDLTLDTALLTGGTSSLTTLSGNNSVTIGNSSVESGGLQVSSSGGTVDVNNNSTLKSDSGDITLEANSDMTIDTATLDSFGNITLTADNDGLTLNQATLTASGHVGLSGKTSVNIGNSSITAGDVDIESPSAAITINNNSSITANTGDLIVKTKADLTVDNATLTGNNNINLTSLNNDLSLNNNTVTATGTAALDGKTSVTVGGGSIAADSVTLNSANGNITVNSAATIAANTITLTAGDGILIDNVTMSGPTRSSPIATLTATAANTITLGSSAHQLDLTQVSIPMMSATTINLNNVLFSLSGVYNFDCASGLAAINPGSSVAGDVNFFNCSIDTTPITALSQIDVTTGASTAAGIHVF